MEITPVSSWIAGRSLGFEAAEYTSVNNSTIVYFEDGIDTRYFDNGTERHFTHDITGPVFVYDNGTIYYASNGSEVFAD